jgi:hypothetical protein
VAGLVLFHHLTNDHNNNAALAAFLTVDAVDHNHAILKAQVVDSILNFSLAVSMRLGLRRFAFQTVNKVGIFRVEQVQFFWLLIKESVVLLDKHPANSIGIYLSKISNLLFRSGHDLEEKFMEQSLVSLKNYLNSLKIEGKSRAQIEADSLVTASSAGQIIENISSVYNIVEQINRNIILNSHSSNMLARKLTVDKQELQLDVFRQELDEMISCLEMAL